MKTKKQSLWVIIIPMMVSTFLLLHCAGSQNGDNDENGDVEYSGVLMARPPGGADTLRVLALRPPGGADTLMILASRPPGDADTLAVIALRPPGGADTLAVMALPLGIAYEPFITSRQSEQGYNFLVIPIPCGGEGLPPCVTKVTYYDFEGTVRAEQSKIKISQTFNSNRTSDSEKIMSNK